MSLRKGNWTQKEPRTHSCKGWTRWKSCSERECVEEELWTHNEETKQDRKGSEEEEVEQRGSERLT